MRMSKNTKSIQISTYFGLALSLALLVGAAMTVLLIHVQIAIAQHWRIPGG